MPEQTRGLGPERTPLVGRERELRISRIPGSPVVIWPDAGQLGLAKHWTEILETLA